MLSMCMCLLLSMCVVNTVCMCCCCCLLSKHAIPTVCMCCAHYLHKLCLLSAHAAAVVHKCYSCYLSVLLLFAHAVILHCCYFLAPCCYPCALLSFAGAPLAGTRWLLVQDPCVVAPPSFDLSFLAALFVC
jgi:hypothetical protein